MLDEAGGATPGSAQEIHGLEGLMQAVGSELGVSPWLTVTQDLVDRFADVTDDHQWIHVDPQRARSGPFGGTVAHGYLTLSLLPSLVKQAYRVTGLAMAVNYGSDKVRFPSPVRVGSRIRARATLLELAPRAAGVQSKTRVEVEIEDGDRPACVAEVLSLLVP